SNLNGFLSFSTCPASATCSSDHKLSFLCGKKRRFGSSSYVCRSRTVASAFLLVQLRKPGSRVISQPGYAAENTPLRRSVLCLSNLNGFLSFSFHTAQYTSRLLL